MSNLNNISITHQFNGDVSAANKVSAADLDTQLSNLAANDNAQKAAIDRITDGNNNLASQTVGLTQLRPELQMAFASQTGWQPKADVAVATIANITLSGEQTIDGVLTSGSRVLVKNQSTQSQNGIYVSSSGVWSRATDADTGSELVYAVVRIAGGATQNGQQWISLNSVAPTIGTTAIQFVQGSFTANPAMQPVVSAPTTAAGMTALGITPTMQPVVMSVTTAAARAAMGPWNDIGVGVANVKAYGAVGDGTTDDYASITAAIASLVNGGVVYLPSGKYRLSASVVIPANVLIRGAGKEWVLVYPDAGVTAFSKSFGVITAMNSGVVDLTIDAKNNSGCGGISLTLCRNFRINSVNFSGVDNAITLDRGDTFQLTDIVNSGNGTNPAGRIKLWSSSDSDYIKGVQLSNLQIWNIGSGVINLVLYIRRCVTSEFSNIFANDMNTNTGILIENDCQGIAISNCHFNHANYALIAQVGSGVAVGPSFINIINFSSDQHAGTAAIQIGASCTWFNLDNIVITSSGINTTAYALNIIGSYVQVNNLFVNGYSGINGTGIEFNGCSHYKIHNAIVANCYLSYAWAGTCIGIMRNCESVSPVNSSLAGTYAQAGVWIESCTGINPGTVTAAPAVPSSTTPYTNNTGFPCQVHVTGGTVTVIAINGRTSGLTAGSFQLNPGETIAITYTVVPNWVWIGK